jgi:hypothetical protein
MMPSWNRILLFVIAGFLVGLALILALPVKAERSVPNFDDPKMCETYAQNIDYVLEQQEKGLKLSDALAAEITMVTADWIANKYPGNVPDSLIGVITHLFTYVYTSPTEQGLEARYVVSCMERLRKKRT